MAHMSEGSSLASLLRTILMCFFLLTLTCKAQSQQVVPAQLVTVTVGDDAVLPCKMKPPADVTQMTVEWGKPDLEPRFVYVWHNNQQVIANQNPAYEGRASMSVDQMKQGDVSLKLSDLRYSDNGRYRCYSPDDRKELFVELLVGVVSSPGISLAGLDAASGTVTLQCESAGWYPEPEVFWVDGEGSLLSAGPTEALRGSDGLYNVSSRVTVEKGGSSTFTCRVQQKNTNQSRETHIHVPGDFFVAPPGCAASISFCVLLFFLLISAVAFFIWKIKPLKKKLQNNEEEIQRLRDEKEDLAEKLEEELERSEQNLKSTTLITDELTKIKEELEKQLKQLTDQREKLLKEAEETEGKIRAVDEEVTQKEGDKTKNKAQGYLKLREIVEEAADKMTERKKNHQDLQMKTQNLVQRMCDEVVKKMLEMKKETKIHQDKIKKEMKEMKDSAEISGQTEGLLDNKK